MDINTLRRDAQDVLNQCEGRLRDLGLLYEYFAEAIRVNPDTHRLFEGQRRRLLSGVRTIEQYLNSADFSMSEPVQELQEHVEEFRLFLESDRRFHPLKLVGPAETFRNRIPHLPSDTDAERKILSTVEDLVAWLVRSAERSVGIPEPRDNLWDIPRRISDLKRYALERARGYLMKKNESHGVHIGKVESSTVVVGSQVNGNVISVSGQRQEEKMPSATKLSKHQLIYSVGGLVLGLACVIGGVVLFLNGVTGSTSWTAKVLGAESTVNDADAGTVLFIVGFFIVFVTRYRFKHSQ